MKRVSSGGTVTTKIMSEKLGDAFPVETCRGYSERREQFGKVWRECI